MGRALSGRAADVGRPRVLPLAVMVLVDVLRLPPPRRQSAVIIVAAPRETALTVVVTVVAVTVTGVAVAAVTVAGRPCEQSRLQLRGPVVIW